ncbi:TPA: DUF2500 domain-containing protein [Photobacterium damselae]
MPTMLLLALVTLLVVAISYFIYTYRRHTLGTHAPEKHIEVMILDKQSNPIFGAQPGEDDEEYWIYVQPVKGGPKREFMVGIHYYHALNPGDSGVMTYKGHQFMHFALNRS